MNYYVQRKEVLAVSGFKPHWLIYTYSRLV